MGNTLGGGGDVIWKEAEEDLDDEVLDQRRRHCHLAALLDREDFGFCYVALPLSGQKFFVRWVSQLTN
jgi:hypothetical protein